MSSLNKLFLTSLIVTAIASSLLVFSQNDQVAPRSLLSARISLQNGKAFFSPADVFDEWLSHELQDTAWHLALPACLQNISLKTNEAGGVSVMHPNAEKWYAVSRAGTLHGNAQYEIRSKPIGHVSSQCTYNQNGALYQAQFHEAGTADFYSPAVSKYLHHIYDVEPYILARDLGRIPDYYKARPPK